MKSHINKMKNIELKYKIWLEKDGLSILGDGKYLLLKTIEQEGSLMAAIEKLEISYRKTWNKLKEIEKKLGFPLLETTRGGALGGGSVLTPEAKKMINAFDNFHKNIDEKINIAFKEFYDELNK